MTFYELLSSQLSIPVTYMYHKTEVGEEIQIPFIAYKSSGQDIFLADNKIYEKTNIYDLEYYFRKKNEELEEELEKILIENGFIYSKSADTYIDTEDVFVIYYNLN